MRNYFVTGGAGFIGSNFIQKLLACDSDISVINYDSLTYAGNLDNLISIASDPRYSFIQGDIRNIDHLNEVFSRQNVDAVIHFAAESHVDRSIENPSDFVLTNVVGTCNLLNVCLAYWRKLSGIEKDNFRFLHISTDEVFGSLTPNDPPFSEDTAYSPNSPYAASKAASDHLVRSYFTTYRLPVIISNCSNNYGPYQFPEKLIPLIILNAIEGLPLPLYGDGMQIRDWLYVEDHCEVLLSILEKGQPGQSYNIGGNNQPTNLEITRQVCRILDELMPNSQVRPHEQLITFIKDRPGHDRRYAMDTTKIYNELSWIPKHELSEGLEKTVRWYLDNTEWVEKIKDRPSYNDWIKLNYKGRGKA
ncbi:MAG: dTDP-glucose 4,6-dehydratase [Chloroflexi bacterium]|nr:dTDP-glucose 4,6-dehydratase [Chloroflexota bacterium]